MTVSITSVSLSENALLAAAIDKSKATKLKVEVDLSTLGGGTADTETVNLRRNKADAVGFKKDCDASAGWIFEGVAKAMDSPEKEDSEVQLLVLACDKNGKELGEIGIAHCSLEELVADGKDHTGSLPIKHAKTGKDAGEVICDITAVGALKDVKAGGGGGGDSFKSGKAATAPITITAGSFTFGPRSSRRARRLCG